MIDLLINYLLHQPSDVTSPIYVALNNVDLLTLLGGERSVEVYDSQAQNPKPPYCLVQQTEDSGLNISFLGSSEANLNEQFLLFSCIATGNNASEANLRADQMTRLVKDTLAKVRPIVFAGGLYRTGIGTALTTSSSKITSWITVAKPPKTVSGGGSDTISQKWTATHYVNLKVMIFDSQQGN